MNLNRLIFLNALQNEIILFQFQKGIYRFNYLRRVCGDGGGVNDDDDDDLCQCKINYTKCETCHDRIMAVCNVICVLGQLC